jgi:long-chain acyl-CoA synthetase
VASRTFRSIEPPGRTARLPLRDSGAVAIFVSTEAQAAKIAAIRGEVPTLKTVIAFDSSAAKNADMTLEALERSGTAGDSPARAAAFQAEALQVKPNDLATIIYTSGTTGEPRA